MIRREFASRWRKVSEKFRASWRQILDDDPHRVARDSRDLAAKIEEKYGIARDSAANEVKKQV
jgi:uncharacterized protein YjbJ (UPF0337 family)